MVFPVVFNPLGTGASTSGGAKGANIGGGAARGSPDPGSGASSTPGISSSGSITRLMTWTVPAQLATFAATILALGVSSWSDNLVNKAVPFDCVKTMVLPFSAFFRTSASAAAACTSLMSTPIGQSPARTWLPRTCRTSDCLVGKNCSH